MASPRDEHLLADPRERIASYLESLPAASLADLADVGAPALAEPAARPGP
ncbi:hypothetical protein ACFYZJ_38145 [Streptomyces sp. NPDC001848]